MEEKEQNQVANNVKQESGKNLNLVILIIVLLPVFALGIILGIYLSNTNSIKSENSEKVDYSQMDVKNVTENNVKTEVKIENKIDAKTENKTKNKIESNDSSLNETKSDLENSESKEVSENKIVLDGGYAFEAGDGFYDFYKDGTVELSGNVDVKKGNYKTIGECLIEIQFTEEEIVDIETGENTSRAINENEKITVIDENTISIDGEKLKKMEFEPIVLDGGYAFEAGDGFYEFYKDGTVEVSGNVDVKKGTYKTIAQYVIAIQLTEEEIVDIETGESTTRTINEIEKIEVIDENTISIDGENLKKWNKN